MASPLTLPCTSLSTPSSSKPVRRFPFLSLCHSPYSPNVSNSRLACTARLNVLPTLDGVSPVPVARHKSSFGFGKFGCISNSSRQMGWLYPTNRPNLAPMASGESSNEPAELNLDSVTDKASRIWGKFPLPVRIFPWNKALVTFLKIIFNLTVFVVKYLTVPVLLLLTLNEVSYIVYKRKIILAPISLVIGFAMAGILEGTADDLYPAMKEAEVPYQLIALVFFGTFLKLLGPYYPYRLKLLVPMFVNGVLVRIFWLLYLWNRRRSQKGAAA